MTAMPAALTQNGYPVLSEMGMTRFDEISHYTLRQEGIKSDILKVYYKRAKGSFLPESRKYRFGRLLKSTLADSARPALEEHYEISPILLEAITELDAIAERKWTTEDARQRLQKELDELESLVSGRLAELRRQIKRL